MSEHEARVEKRLEAARREIQDWRAGRVKLGPMPKQLWAEAVKLAGEVSVARAARELELDHGGLSKRVSPKRLSGLGRSTASSEFVEVSKAPPVARAMSAVIELTSAAGNRLTVRLSEPVDVGQLMSQFQASQ